MFNSRTKIATFGFLIAAILLLMRGQVLVSAFLEPKKTPTLTSTPTLSTAPPATTATGTATRTPRSQASTVTPTSSATSLPSIVTKTKTPTASATQTVSATKTVTATPSKFAAATPTKTATSAQARSLSASPGTVSSLSTAFVVQNTDPSVTANISATIYSLLGTPVETISRTVAPNLSTTVDQRTDSTLSTGFQGSAVLSSNTFLASVVQEFSGSTATLGTGFRSDVYNGVPNSSAAATVLLPQLTKNICDPNLGVGYCYNSTVAIQNTNPATSANVTLTYKNLVDGQTYTHSGISIPANSSVFIDMSNELPTVSAFNGSATITSDQPVAVMVNHNIAGALLVYQGFTTAKSGTKLIIPQLLKNVAEPNTGYSYQSGFMVMVYDGSSADVTVTYNNFANNHIIMTTLTANPSIIFDQRYDPALAGESVFYGTAVVTSAKPVVAIVNFVTNFVGGIGIRNTSYPAFPDGSGTTRVFFPLAMKAYFDSGTNVTWGTGLAGRVMTNSPATVTLTYYSGANTYTSTQNVSASQPQFTFDQRFDSNLPTTFYGSAVLTSTQPVIANINIVGLASNPGDVLGTYIGINQ